MESIKISFEKTEPSEIINKGELIELGPDNKVTRCSTERSSLVIGVAADEFVGNNKPTYFIGDININEDKQEKLNVIVGGLALVKTLGLVNIGDMLVSSGESGRARSIRYTDDKGNIGKIIGKAIQYTEKDDEVIALISLS